MQALRQADFDASVLPRRAAACRSRKAHGGRLWQEVRVRGAETESARCSTGGAVTKEDRPPGFLFYSAYFAPLPPFFSYVPSLVC